MSEDSFQYDFNGMEPASGMGGGGAIPPGKYLAAAEQIELGLSSGGYQQVALTWRLVDGEYEGRTVRDWITFAPKSGPFILAYMVAANIAKPKGPVGPADLAPYFAQKIDGATVQLTLGLRPYTAEDGTQKQGNKILRVDSATMQQAKAVRETLSEEELADVPF